MTIKLTPNFTLQRYDSVDIVPLGSKAAETYERQISLNGNSILSTLYIKSMDIGASITVNFYDNVSGESRRLIGSHGTLTGETEFHDKLVVTEIHNSFIAEVVITGGSVEFMLMTTMVDNFPIDIKGKLDGSTANLSNDTGLPSVIYNGDDGKFYLTQGTSNGAILVQDIALSDLAKTFEISTIGTSWTAVPLIAEGDQKSIGIQNQSDTQMKINFSNAGGTYTGWILEGGDAKFYDISSVLIVYIRTDTETNKKIVVEVVG